MKNFFELTGTEFLLDAGFYFSAFAFVSTFAFMFFGLYFAR